MADSPDVILTRSCWIQPLSGDEPSPLTISFLRPYLQGEGMVKAEVTLSCRYFDHTIWALGDDDAHAFVLLLNVVVEWLLQRCKDEFTAYFSYPGDLEYFDFWVHQQKPPRYVLPSAFNPARMRGLEASDRYLKPSHRIAIDKDEPAIVSYFVMKDGVDSVSGLISGEDIAKYTPDELCRRLGEMILMNTPEGRKLLGFDM